jgi:acetate---CoA ligase (ADP-forming)
LIETLHDVALRLAPINESEAKTALAELRGGALLDGARGAPGVNREALAALLAKLSSAVARAPWCAELDLNPVIAGGNRFVIVDARLRVEVPRA